MHIKPGKYIHFKGSEYEVSGMATHSETMEEMVIYRAMSGDGGVWVRPAVMWNEMVEHNGKHIKRFVHEDEVIYEPPPAGIHKRSAPSEKIGLFLSLFSGRDDVFAKRWENPNDGRTGYSPACRNEWSPPCSKKKKKRSPQPLDEVHSIYDNHTFYPVYSADIMAARNEILIVSPYLTKKRTLSAMSYLSAANVKATVLTRPADDYPEKARANIADCMELLAQQGITIKTKESIHQKFAIIDQRVIWYGSINLLSYGKSEESIMRIENVNIAAELLGSIQP